MHVLHGAGLDAFAAFVLALPLVTLATFAANRRITFRGGRRDPSYV